MIRVFIGHRGTGKTTLFKKLDKQGLLKQFNWTWIDLDSAIEEKQGLPINEIFLNFGESAFRHFEREVFEEILQKSYEKNLALIAGAGFELQLVPKDVPVTFLRRDSDSEGRIFLNRPRLFPQLSPLQEFRKAFLHREPRFLERAQQVVTLPEGLPEDLTTIAEIIFGSMRMNEAIITWFENEQNSNLLELTHELRTDLLNTEKINNLVQQNPNEKWLVSVRTDFPLERILDLKQKTDIDIQFPPVKHVLEESHKDSLIVSSHVDSIDNALVDFRRFENSGTHLKLCPLIETWSDLKKGWLWQQEQPQYRSFLPRSNSGRWAWYRLLMKNRQSLNFIRNGVGSSQDQPSVFEYASTPTEFSQFAAVLGSPIRHSHSPIFHHDFFANLQMPYFKIQMTETEWDEALPILVEWGLMAASVTSPLKQKAFVWAGQQSHKARELASANTLVLDKETSNWLCDNTDHDGFLSTLTDLQKTKSIVVWGGGGTLSFLRQIFPQAVSYSSQTGKPRANEHEIDSPEILIWAAPRYENQILPPARWRPLVLDLNYSQNSMGIEYSQQKKLSYISGEEFFKAQARLQQNIWRQYL